MKSGQEANSFPWIYAGRNAALALAVYFFLCSFSFSQDSNKPIEFEVSGEVTYELYDRDQTSRSWTDSFVVSVRGEEWRVETIDANSNHLTAARDSQGLLRTLFANSKTDKQGAHSWSNVGYVQHADLPVQLGKPFLEPLWMTFCSSAYLKASTNGMISPIWTLDDPSLEKQGFRQAASWSFNDNSPYLPEHVIYLNDGFYRGADSNSKSTLVPLPPPYNNGYTNAVYSASSFTNVGPYSIPIEFAFKTFGVPLQKGMSADIPRDSLLGHVTSIKLQCAENILKP